MLTHPTIEKLHALHLPAMAQAFEQQRGSSQHAELSFEDRFGLLVETEWTAREQRRLTQRLRQAKPRYPGAAPEDVDFTTPRGLPREVVLSLGTGAWIRDHHNLLMSGPTGIGKSWLASAFVNSACRHGFTATYVRAPRLLHELAVSRGDGSYARLLAKLAKLDLLAIDDWLLAPLTDAERRDLLEVIEDRSERASTLIATQLPPTAWHAALGEPSVADAICDRLIHRAHRLTLKGPTMRDPDTRRGGKAKS
jgi:DNA replication protein DnaC